MSQVCDRVQTSFRPVPPPSGWGGDRDRAHGALSEGTAQVFRTPTAPSDSISSGSDQDRMSTHHAEARRSLRCLPCRAGVGSIGPKNIVEQISESYVETGSDAISRVQPLYLSRSQSKILRVSPRTLLVFLVLLLALRVLAPVRHDAAVYWGETFPNQLAWVPRLRRHQNGYGKVLVCGHRRRAHQR